MARAAEPKIDRRAVIARALYDCICSQGYASTTLTDIADRAKMSPSHVGYYFDNKAAILEYYSVELCEQMLISPSHASRTIDKAETMGFVRRVPDPMDRRAQLVTLTEAGIKVVSEFSPHLRDVLGRIIYRTFTAAEIETLVELLGRLARAAGDLDEQSPEESDHFNEKSYADVDG